MFTLSKSQFDSLMKETFDEGVKKGKKSVEVPEASQVNDLQEYKRMTINQLIGMDDEGRSN